jgi:serine/threonine protein phosphatase PrpC
VSEHTEASLFQFAGHTDVGRRKHNEDAFLIDPDLGLLVVADGVGGHHSGEVASALTIEVLRREISAGSDLASAIQMANNEVKAGVEIGKGKAGMATTVVALRLTGDQYELAWVGDSRAYLWDGQLKLLTRDHSFVEAQLAAGQITLEEARTHPRRHVILQAIGLQKEGSVEIGSNSGRLGAGNTLLLCSDGVTDPLDNEQLSHLIGRGTPAQDTSSSLVNTALQCGGKDNSTAVIVQYKPESESEPGTAEQLVWAFDPDTKKYEGLPDSTPKREEAGANLEETQVMRVKAVPATDKSSAEPSGSTDDHTSNTGWPYIFLVAIVGTTFALTLVYSLR